MNFLKSLFQPLKNGDAPTKLSYLIMGLGCVCHRQIVKGIIFFLIEILFFVFFFGFSLNYLKDFLTLGTKTQTRVWDESEGIYRYIQGDNSMLILLFSVVSIVAVICFLALYFLNVKSAYNSQLVLENGKNPNTFFEDIKDLLDKNFHRTLLAVPTFFVTIFTILPIVFMVLIAFTNFDQNHQPPGNLFTWTGFEVFKELFATDPVKTHTIIGLLGWTLVWAVFATATNYIFGIILALLINKKGIKLKRMWRTFFVITIAVPQFVSLMLMSQLLNDNGAVNTLLLNWGVINEPIHFLTNTTLARITVILVNMWVGIPYTLLIATGILINIPEELYESAKIDGASPTRTFVSITMPYMLFITTPYLITQFVGNINNFNVIYLLTGGEPATLEYFRAGKTDLLVTWLYKQTVNFQNYNLASAIGIIVFVISAVFSILIYRTSGSNKREGEFQ